LTSDQPQPAAPDDQPKGPSNLRLRVIWGALAAALLFGCTFGGPISFGLFFAAVQAVMLKEFYRIMRANGYQPAFWIGIVVSIVGFAAVFTIFFSQAMYLHGVKGEFAASHGASIFEAFRAVISPLAVAAVFLLPVLLLIREMRLWPQHSQPFSNVAVTLLGLAYVSIPMSLLNALAFVSNKGFFPRHVFLLIFLIWAADTGAYFAGKNFGKHKLAPSISPGKTWEGWVGGALLTLAVGWAAGLAVPDVPLGHRLVAAGVVAVFGPLGDLAESMLKRSAGVKDSGTFLPGHGGLLDRFDAFLLVLPVLALVQVLVG